MRELKAKWKEVMKTPGRIPQELVEEFQRDVEAVKANKYGYGKAQTRKRKTLQRE